MFAKNNKNIVILLFLLVCGFALYILTSHNAFLYRQDIGKVIKIKQGSVEKTTDEFKNKDQTHSQLITIALQNGKYRGQEISLNNKWSDSGAFDQKFRLGQQIFLDLRKKGDKLTGEISGYKRDTYLVLLAWLVMALLFMTMKFSGLRTLLSVAINFVVFLFFVNLDVQLNLTNFFWLFALSAVLFTALSLILVIGFNEQCLVTFLAIFTGTALALCSGILVLNHGGSDLHYEALDFATQAPKQLFLSATVIGLLGAVMDAATDIVSTVFELRREDPAITHHQLFKSGMEVGRSILGPLINVLLLIFFAETFAMGTLFFRTGNSIGYTFEWTMSLGIVQSLISGIGIVLVIPAASAFSALILKGGKKDAND